MRQSIARRAGLIGGLIAITGVVAACPDTPAVDLLISSVEVTQGIQTTTNSVQLIAQRSTAVRATLGGGGPAGGITGRLHVFVGGSEITPAAGIAAINQPFTAPASPQRANENDTLNFELPAPSGIGASNDVDFHVDFTYAQDTNAGNNSGEALNLVAVARTTPTIFYTRIDYTPSGLGLPSATLVAPGAGDAMLRGIYPVNDGDPNLYRQGLFPTLTFGQDANGDGKIDGCGTDCNDLLNLLASCRQLIVDNGLGASNNTFLHGWVNGNPIIGNGWSTLNGRNSFGNTEISRGQRTFAHEVGHGFGRDHPLTDLNLDQVGWDVGARLANNWAGNNVTGRVRPTTLFDVMVPAKLTKDAWVDTLTWAALFGSPILADSSTPDGIASAITGHRSDLVGPLAQPKEPSERVAVVQGIFDPDGKRILRLDPVFRYPWPSQPVVDESGIYVVEITDDAGNVLTANFDGLLSEDGERLGEIRGFFEVMVPVSAGSEIASLRITDQGGQELASLERSAPPEISIVTPSAGADLGEKPTISWEAKDPDTAQDQLQYQLAWSPDGGTSWSPIAVDIPGFVTELPFDGTQLRRTEGNGVLRIFVSDGLNTVFADVEKLSASAATLP